MSEKIEFAGDYAAMLWALYTIRAVAEGFADDGRGYLCGCGSAETTIVTINAEQFILPICSRCAADDFIQTLGDEAIMELFGF